MSKLDVECVPWRPAFVTTNNAKTDAVVTIVYKGGETVTVTLPPGASRYDSVARAQVSVVWPATGRVWPANGKGPHQTRCGLTPKASGPPITSGPFDPTPVTLPVTMVAGVPGTLPFTGPASPLVAEGAVLALAVGAALLLGARRRGRA